MSIRIEDRLGACTGSQKTQQSHKAKDKRLVGKENTLHGFLILFFINYSRVII
jgi:hypothetical protein